MALQPKSCGLGSTHCRSTSQIDHLQLTETTFNVKKVTVTMQITKADKITVLGGESK